MEQIAAKFTSYMIKKGIISEEKEDIYLYGLISFLEILINLICSICIGIYLNMEYECILFFVFFIPLRSYFGGLHLNTYFSCLIFSCITLTGVLLLVKFWNVGLIVSFLLYLISLIFLKLIGAVNHPNRTVDKLEDVYFQKKANLTIMLSFFLAVIFLMTNTKKFLFLEALVFLLVCCTLLIGKLKYCCKDKGV